jgi:predicted metal-binding membrane protein
MITALITRPDRLVIAVAALLWVWMLGEAAVAQRISCCGPFPTRAIDFTSWMVMVGAMMLPTTTPAVRDVATRSYRRRQSRVVLE